MKKLLVSIMTIVLVTILTSCGATEEKITAEDFIQQFVDDGLEVGEVSDLPNKEYGETRLEGKRILIPSLGEDSGGRLFIFKDEEGIDKAKGYYDELGTTSPLLYSHTYQNGLVLLQMNGDMEDAVFKQYTKAIDAVMQKTK